jgi:ribosome recycling factor
MDNPQEILDDAELRMDGAVEKLGGDFATIRTGRANPQVLQRVTVEYYGTRTPLLQLANCAVPEPRMLVVNPYDKSALNDIEKAIRESDLGLNPANDGDVIRCVFPELTRERRQEYIRLAGQYAEEARIAIRNVRRHARDELSKLDDEGVIGEDEHQRWAKQLEELTSREVASVDRHLKAKEEELSEI